MSYNMSKQHAHSCLAKVRESCLLRTDRRSTDETGHHRCTARASQLCNCDNLPLRRLYLWFVSTVNSGHTSDVLLRRKVWDAECNRGYGRGSWTYGRSTRLHNMHPLARILDIFGVWVLSACSNSSSEVTFGNMTFMGCGHSCELPAVLHLPWKSSRRSHIHMRGAVIGQGL